MNIVLYLRTLYNFYSHNFEKVLKLNNCDIYNLPKNRESVRFQALSSFFMKNYYHSRKCYELLEKNNLANYDDYNKLAYIYSRHNEKENTIISLCKSLELKKNKTASLALDYIRNKGRDINLIEDPYFEELICKKPIKIDFKKIFIIKLIFILILSIGFAIFFNFKNITKLIERINKKDRVINVNIDDFNPNIISRPKDPQEKYSFNENEVKKLFNETKNFIISNDVNNAIININKLLLSNASISIKSKVEILKSFIEEPDYYYFKNTINYQSVKDNTVLYNGIYIKWEGKVVNYFYDKKNKIIKFNLIIGNEEEGIIEGVIPVVFEKAVKVQNNDKIIIFGKIKNVKENDFYIEGLFAIKK